MGGWWWWVGGGGGWVVVGGGWCTPIFVSNPTVSCQLELELELSVGLGFDNLIINFQGSVGRNLADIRALCGTQNSELNSE